MGNSVFKITHDSSDPIVPPSKLPAEELAKLEEKFFQEFAKKLTEYEALRDTHNSISIGRVISILEQEHPEFVELRASLTGNKDRGNEVKSFVRKTLKTPFMFYFNAIWFVFNTEPSKTNANSETSSLPHQNADSYETQGTSSE
jgi:hypothetical protein